MKPDFDPRDPFPLVEPGTYTLEAAKTHARLCDKWLGLRVAAAEASIDAEPREAGRETWIGLDAQALQTTYFELRYLVERLAPGAGQRMVDIGSGYARLAHVLARHAPGCRFTGYEIVEARAHESQRAARERGLEGTEIFASDVAAPQVPLRDAEFYFLYDFGSRSDIDATLDKVRAHAQRHPVAVAARGRSSRDAIERRHPWLSQIVAPEHFPSFSIYRSAATPG